MQPPSPHTALSGRPATAHRLFVKARATPWPAPQEAPDFLSNLWQGIAAATGQEAPKPRSRRKSELGWRTGIDKVYAQEEKMGVGAFGTVHAGVHRKTNESFAIKTLLKVRASSSLTSDTVHACTQQRF